MVYSVFGRRSHLGINREGLYLRYFGVHNHDLALIKKAPPRAVEHHIAKINIAFDARL